MKRFRIDLHIHSCLSACAELDMTPTKIIKRAIDVGLDAIAITDHNSAENFPAFVTEAIAGESNSCGRIKVFPGMEITSSEEVHILAIFDRFEDLKSLQEIVYDTLQGPEFDESLGYQLVVNEKEEILSFVKRPLIGATLLTSKDIVELIHTIGGIAIASHIDKEVFSIISQLGFIPKDIRFNALELSIHTSIAQAKERFGNPSIPFIRSSDSHHLNEIGRTYTEFLLKELTLQELRMALREEGGRLVVLPLTEIN